MRQHRIDFDNKRQLDRYTYILFFLIATFCIMAYWDVDNEICMPWLFLPCYGFQLGNSL
jgi:hypothetical protein